jgi:rod shape-determining protein MreD
MIYYLLLPLFLLLLVIVQITVLDLFTLGWVGMEISLVVVIYSGFHLDAFRGCMISLLLGFFLDCLTSAIFGLYTFLYILIFYFSTFVAGKIYAEKPSLIAFFTGFCTLLEGLIIILLYLFFLDAKILYAIPKIFIPKAILLGLLSPFLFHILHRFEASLHADETRSAQRI